MDKFESLHESVQEFYGKAADVPKNDLCCPTSYPTEDIEHIPQQVLDRYYGCGSPIINATLREGENVLDLGSGAGIDCFIASKKVGSSGSVIGVDMTDNMLKIANECKIKVSKNLGYDNVEFRKGYLEEIPATDKTVDLITSNCVVNLSPDKRKVFSEIWRVLKDNGRLVISDIVSDKDLPLSISNNKQLWGECLGGALNETQFLSYLEQAGFYGTQILSKTYWENIEKINFYSLTIKAYKFQKSPNCIYKGHKAVYNGPFKVIIDDEGHVFNRNQEVEVCTDTVAKLLNPPYKGSFTIIESLGDSIKDTACFTTNGNSSCC